ncbi:MAG: hypothetical protein A2284_08975 [Deltaproteobacteria bacterium RIFOXYA12_FULL_61_11]|nr:MAG: hypothetical protein A2284_08975 [Deltaproteobacteria bacterium RIFOXYA12_FULL_61_11]
MIGPDNHPLHKEHQRLSCLACHLSPEAPDRAVRAAMVLAVDPGGKVELFERTEQAPGFRGAMFTFGTGHNVVRQGLRCSQCHQTPDRYLPEAHPLHHGWRRPDRSEMSRLLAVGICLVCHEDGAAEFMQYRTIAPSLDAHVRGGRK